MLVSESVVSESACRFNKADMQDDQPKLNPYHMFSLHIAFFSVSLPCQCPAGNGCEWTSPALSFEWAYKYADLHMKSHYCSPKKTQPIATDNVEVDHQNYISLKILSGSNRYLFMIDPMTHA